MPHHRHHHAIGKAKKGHRAHKAKLGHHHVSMGALAHALNIPGAALTGRAQTGVVRHNAAGTTTYR